MVRIKHRYLLVDFLSPSTFDSASADSSLPATIRFHAPLPPTFTPPLLLRVIRAQVSELFGDYGVGVLASGLAVKYLSNATATAIIRAPRDHYRLVWAGLTCLSELPVAQDKRGGSRDTVCRVVRVSGTIRKCEEEAVRRARNSILRVKKDGGSERERILEGIVGDGKIAHAGDGGEDYGSVMDVDGEEGESTSDEEG